jgi:hypothetical protein
MRKIYWIWVGKKGARNWVGIEWMDGWIIIIIIIEVGMNE